MADVDLFGNVAQELLDAVVQGMETDGIVPPTRQLVINGALTMDSCEQLAVSLSRLYPASAFAEVLDVINCSTAFTVDLLVIVTRCLPQAPRPTVPPPADALTAATKAVAKDGLSIARTIVARAQDHTLLPSLVSPSISLGPLEPVEKQGGYHGFSQLVRVALI